MSTRAALRGAGRVVAWVVILGVGAALAVAVLVPRVGGAVPYAVLTGSMQPTLPPGSLVVVRPVAAEDVAIGDIITYQLDSGQAPVVTHRVLGIRTDLQGRTTFLTRGDANTAMDAAPVLPVQIRGRLWYDVPLLGHVHTLLSGAQHRLVVWAVAGGLLVYAAAMFVGVVRDRRRVAA